MLLGSFVSHRFVPLRVLPVRLPMRLPLMFLRDPSAGLRHFSSTQPPAASSFQRRVAVVGAGLAGLSCATSAAHRGLSVDLFEASSAIGGQFGLAALVPGKEEYQKLIDFFAEEIREARGLISLSLEREVSARDLGAEKYSAVVLATGAVARPLSSKVEGRDLVLSYYDAFKRGPEFARGKKVAIIGSGGIARDLAKFFTEEEEEKEEDEVEKTHHSASSNQGENEEAAKIFFERWGLKPPLRWQRSGPSAAVSSSAAVSPPHSIPTKPIPPAVDVTILKRGSDTSPVAATGESGSKTVSNVEVAKVDSTGVYAVDGRFFSANIVVNCIGQIPLLLGDLSDIDSSKDVALHVIGAAHNVAGAKRAIKEGREVAEKL